MTMNGSRKKLRLVLISLVAVIAVVIGWFANFSDQPNFFDSGSDVSANASTSSTIPLRVGSMNGVRLAIPANYFFFPMVYQGESPWGKSAPDVQRTQDSLIDSFSLYVRWPDMAPRSLATEDSYQQSRKGTGMNSWMMIGVQANPKGSSTTVETNNGLARILKTYFEYPERFSIPKNIKYGIESIEERYGLNKLDPVGFGAESFEIWNKTLLWEGDMDGKIATLITCQNGKLINKSDRLTCRHEFYIENIDAKLAVTYTIDHLSDWSSIKDKVSNLVLSFAKNQ